MANLIKIILSQDTVSNIVRHDFDGRTEKDSHEFLIWLLIKLAEDSNRGNWKIDVNIEKYTENNIKSAAKDYIAKQHRYSSSVVSDVFFSIICKTTSCNSCPKTELSFEKQLDLRVHVHLGDVDLMTSINRYFQLSYGRCSNCTINAGQTTNIWALPDILIIRPLKDEIIKNSVVPYPVDDLDMRPYLHPEAPATSEGTKYSLYGIVIHLGPSYRTGHFIAKVKNMEGSNDLWQLFNDRDVQRIPLDEVKKAPAYILFYERKALCQKKKK
uniref:ubiquitinyl hydrolase 1 n=1 Tax=Meloidogyne hapla TaxID=6305 RepID=A0A1I8AWY3_MELHA